MNEGNKFALVPRPSSAVEKPKLGKERILSGMVADTLALVKKELRPKHRILLVDDEADTIRLLESVICDWFKEATVLTFQDGDKAWQELQREDPDILITDLIRPGSMNGWEMISMLAERKVKYPIVLLTGRTKVPGPVKEMYQQGKMTSEEFMYEVMHTPADDVQDLLRRVSPPLNITFLGKPFENEELLKVLKACLEKGKMPRKSRPLKIVMVNDEEGVLRSFELVIQRWFKDVTMLFFDNGAAALDELLRTDPDLLITDDTMPVMSGGELCQRLFERRVTYPIIVDSAWEPTEQ
ncbi:MAG: response regulator [Verrucomicrobiota bacterium]